MNQRTLYAGAVGIALLIAGISACGNATGANDEHASPPTSEARVLATVPATDPPTTTEPPTTTTEAPTTTTTEPPATTTTLTDVQQVAQWVNDNDVPLEAIVDDMTAIGQAAGNYDLIGMMSACQDLVDDATDAQNVDAPYPVEDDRATWDTAIDESIQAGVHCVRGVTNVDPDELQQSVDLITHVGVLITQITDHLD